MIVKVKIRYYDEYEEEVNDRIQNRYLFICADEYREVIDKLNDYYDINKIEKVSMEPIAPCDFLEFKEEDKDLFKKIADKVEQDVVW